MPDVTSTLLAMYQQIIGGSTAREQSSLEAEAARRVILSGMNIGSNGSVFIGTLNVTTLAVNALQVVGNMSTTGSVTVGTTLTVLGTVTAGPGTHTFGGAGNTSLVVQNTAAASNAFAAMNVGNDVTAGLGSLQAFSSLWPAVAGAIAQPNGVALQATGAGGLAMNAGAGVLRLFTSGALRVNINAGGFITVNPVAGLTALNTQFALAFDASVVANGINLQNVSASLAGFMGFFNSAGASAGGITQTGAATVAFVTSSDARLKRDLGPAIDVSALRGVAVHDFLWHGDDTLDRGVFAQEAIALFPRAVVPGTDETTQSGELTQPWMTDYSKFVPDLIVGWQQHDHALAQLSILMADLRTKLRGAYDA